MPLAPAVPRAGASREFRERRDTYDGWGTFNRHYWVEHYEDFLEFFFSQCLTEPHSTKPHEDTVGWGLETDARRSSPPSWRPGSGTRRTCGRCCPGSTVRSS